MPRPNRLIAKLVGVLLLLQLWVPVQAVAAMAAEASSLAAAESMCRHDEDGPARPGAADPHRHHALCPACYACCTMPAALPAGAGALPLPQFHGRLRRRRIVSPPRCRAPGYRPKARGPPSSPDRPCRLRTRISVGHDADLRGDHT